VAWKADLEELRTLAAGNLADRAYADALIRLQCPPGTEGIHEVRAMLRKAARDGHADLRNAIAKGLRGADLRRRFDAVSPTERDHFVEEVLGIAYPPLEEHGEPPEPELIAYTPSGYDEIVHAFDVTKLGPNDRFLDLGSGMGKAVLLAVLLAGATGVGIERDRALCETAKTSARELAIAPSKNLSSKNLARFDHGDARTAAFDAADVVFMYLPFTGSVLASVMTRVMAQERHGSPRFVCAGALDTNRWPLVLVGAAKSWLHVYARRDHCSC
jgi:protein-L-isoaspartate O-methyltransferase